MERLIERRLLEWKDSPGRKPLVLMGVRQCGKTYVLRKFGEEHFRNVAYFDFENRGDLSKLFWNLDVHRIVKDLSRRSGMEITEDTLIVFDEVQACYPALTSLKYFCQDASEYHVVCAGSLLGLAVGDHGDVGDARSEHSFPVGKVNFLHMHPMCFGEFVMARLGDETFDYLDSMGPHDEIPEDLMSILEAAYREYLLVGGMPEAVDVWCSTEDMSKVREVQRDIIASYENDMGKHGRGEYDRITAIWRSAARQLAESGDRFMLKDAGGTVRNTSGPLEWLLRADLMHRAWEVNDDRVPPNPRGGIYFKLYYPDVGLLTCKAGVEYDTLSDRDGFTSGIRGAIAENFVLNELTYALDLGDDAFYWANGKGSAEVDFLVTFGLDPVPVEVKSGKVGRIQSLETYCSKYSPKAACVVSGRNVRLGGAGEYSFVPLYMVWKFVMYAEALGLGVRPMNPPPMRRWDPAGGFDDGDGERSSSEYEKNGSLAQIRTEVAGSRVPHD